MPRKKTEQSAANSGLATVTGDTFNYDEAAAKAVVASKRMIDVLDNAERMSIGTWYYPSGWPDERMRSWSFIRCGMKNSPAALQLAARLRSFGYREAPRGITCVGFEGDGENMLVMCAPMECHKTMRSYNAQQKRRVAYAVADSFSDVSIGGAKVSVTGNEGRGNDSDFTSALRGSKTR